MVDTIIQGGIGLAICRDVPTPGEGICFYHSVVQQLVHPDLRSAMREAITFNTESTYNRTT